MQERTKGWRFIVDGPADAAWNMAVDEALAASAAAGDALPALRIYRWRRPAVTIGYFQSWQEEVDHGYCRRHGLDVVRRITGGRAIVHDPDEITYSVTAPLEGPFRGASLHEIYTRLSEALVRGLRLLGIPAEFTGGRRRAAGRGRTPVCFQSLSFAEASVQGRKVIGSAQKRWSRRFLQQGSIPLTIRTGTTFSALSFPTEALRERALRAAPRKMAGLREFRPGIGPDEIVEALRRGFAESFGVRMLDDGPTGTERDRARELVRTRYGAAAWNMRR